MSVPATTLEALVLETLACLEGGRPLPPGVEALNGGITNHKYRFTLGPDSFVLRAGGRDSPRPGVDRSRESDATRIAGTLGVGAELLWTDPARGVMVTRLIPGPTLTAATAVEPATLRRIVESLRVVHAGPGLAGHFSPFDSASELHEQALDRGVSPPPELDEAFILLARIEAVLPAAAPDVPCHTDLRPAKLIDDSQRIRIIDWERAGMGDCFCDLGSLAANLALPDEASGMLLEYYFGELRESDLARLFLMRMVIDLYQSCRAFAAHGNGPAGTDGYASGTRHLNRFLAGARDEKFLPLLRRASQPRMQRPQA